MAKMKILLACTLFAVVAQASPGGKAGPPGADKSTLFKKDVKEVGSTIVIVLETPPQVPELQPMKVQQGAVAILPPFYDEPTRLTERAANVIKPPVKIYVPAWRRGWADVGWRS